MSIAKRLPALILAGLMLVGLASCAQTGGGDNTTADTTASVDLGDETEELYLGYEKDTIPTTLNYGGSTVKILYWDDSERPEFEVAEDADDGDRIVSAIKARNSVVQDRLGVTFEWEGYNGNTSNRSKFTKYVETQFSSSNYYDIIATYSRTSGMLATRGFLADLNTIDDNYLNYEKPWWPDTLIDTCTIGQSLYFVSGDASTNTLHFMYGVYYNKELVADYQLEDPQTLTLNGTWTIDQLMSMTKDKYQDLNNNDKQDAEDFVPFGTKNFHCDAFYTGSDLMLVEEDADKVLVISPDFSSEKAVDLVAKLGTWLPTNDTILGDDYMKPFVAGQGLFCLNRVYMADNVSSNGLNAVTWTYGIVPVPKYNLDQENYITVMGNPFTLYSVGNGSSDPSMATAVIECWASEAYRRTTPAIFEINMKLKYSKENVDAQMFDIIRSTVRYDLGRIFADTLNLMSEMPSKAACAGSSWSSGLASKIKILENKCAEIVTDLEKNANLVR